eukprot:RCo031096
MPVYDITVVIGWLRGLQGVSGQVQAVWEAFGVSMQTELRDVTPLFDAQGGAMGTVAWNESFEVQDTVVPTQASPNALDVAFWHYPSPDAEPTVLDFKREPTALGFKRVDITECFHSNAPKAVEFSVPIEGQPAPAQAHIQLTVREKSAPPAEPCGITTPT